VRKVNEKWRWYEDMLKRLRREIIGLHDEISRLRKIAGLDKGVGGSPVEFREIQRMVFEEYKKNGYLERWSRAEELLEEEMSCGEIVSIAEVGLFAAEVVECIEALRDAEISELGYELADIVIRVMNFASRKGIDLERFIIAKHKENLKR